jgi:hypothetical protein
MELISNYGECWRFHSGGFNVWDKMLGERSMRLADIVGLLFSWNRFPLHRCERDSMMTLSPAVRTIIPTARHDVIV